MPDRLSSLPGSIEIPRESLESARNLIHNAPLGPLAPMFEKWFIGDVEQIYSKLVRSNRSFFDAMLDSLNIRYRCAPEQIRHIPAEGPVMIVANHPFGLLDGVVLGAILSARRRDFAS